MGPLIRNSLGTTIIALAAALGSSDHPVAVVSHNAFLGTPAVGAIGKVVGRPVLHNGSDGDG